MKKANIAVEEPPAIEKHWRVDEVAERLSLSVQTVRRIFRDRPVRFLGTRNSTRRKRRYTIMLIPDSVLRAYLAEIEG